MLQCATVLRLGSSYTSTRLIITALLTVDSGLATSCHVAVEQTPLIVSSLNTHISMPLYTINGSCCGPTRRCTAIVAITSPDQAVLRQEFAAVAAAAGYSWQ